MILQSKYLSMVGLGIKESEDIVDGNHLRWFFDPALGFPKYGFKLYGRHIDCSNEKECFGGIPIPSILRVHVSPWGDYEGVHDSPLNVADLTFESERKIQVTNDGMILQSKKALKIYLPETSNKVELSIDAPHSVNLKISIYFAGETIEKNVKNLHIGKNQIIVSSDAFESIELTVRDKRTFPIRRHPIKPEIPYILIPPVVLSKICWNPISNCDYEWEEIAEFCLPVGHGDYPCKHGCGSDWEAATSRLDENKVGKYNKDPFEELHLYLEELVKSSTISQDQRVRDEKYQIRLKDEAGELENLLDRERMPERLREAFELNGILFSENVKVRTLTRGTKWEIEDNSNRYMVEKRDKELHTFGKTIPLQPLQMVLLSSLDQGVAQMLGLYYINLPVEEDVATGVKKDRAYDYKIVGCWTKIGCEEEYGNDKEKLHDMYPVDFSSIQFDDSPISFQERGFDFRSGNTISADETNRGYIITIKDYLTIDFPRPMSMLNIDISLIIGPVNLKIQKGDGSIVSDGLAVAGSKIFEDHNSGIVSIEIIGYFHLYEFSYAEMNYAWITSNIKMEKREAIDKPYGLKTYLLPGKSVVKKEDGPERVIYAPATVGLKWNLASAKVTEEISGTVHSLDVVNEDTHVFYMIERQQLGENKDPEPINSAAFEIINKEKPVLVPRLPEVADGTRIEPESPPEWPLQARKEKEHGIMSLFYIDAGDTDDKGLLEKPLVKDTWYTYQVIGIDMFGRHSEPSNPALWYNTDGRLEHPSAIHLEDRFPPPPPLVISAKFVDPKDPYLQENENKWMAEEGKRKGFRVIWKWPENLQIQAPDAEKFRIYFKPGLLNVLEGKVKEVTCFDESENMGLHLKGEIVSVNEADNEITMEMKAGEEIEIDTDPSNRYFKYDRNFFDITEISRSDYDAENEIQTITFTIEREVELQRHKPAILEIQKEGINLRGNIRQVRDNNRITIRIPSDVEVKIPLESEKEKFIKYGNKRLKVTDVVASSWSRRNKYLTAVLIVDNPITIESTEESGKTGVFDVDNSEVEVHFDEVVDIEEDSFARRIFRQRGKNFVIIKNTASESILDSPENPVNKVVFTVQNLTLPPREIPGINKSASLLIDSANPLFINYGKSENWGTDGWDGMVLEVDKGYRELFDEFIPEEVILEERHRLRPTPQEPMTSGNVGIATVDDSENESSVSPPQPVFAVLRDKPERPSMPDISELWATIPDYYGISHFDVKWPVDERAYFYQVYRTMDKTLMLVDIEEHTRLHRNMDLINDIWGEGSERESDIQPDLTTLDDKISAWRDPPDDKKQKKLKELMETYTSLRNDTKQYLASLPENEKAFVPVSSPLDPIKPENWEDADNMFFKDSIEGKGRNRYFYRIGAMDKAGNRSYLGLATPPVCVPDVIPPKPPVITKALGGNRKAIIRWRRNTEPEMVRYEIYRTDKKEDAADVRLMGEPVVIDADAEGMPIRAQVINSAGYLDVSFIPNAQSINEVYEVNEEGERVSEENYFGGFKSLTFKVSIDEGEVEVQYRDTEDVIVTKYGKAFKGQLKVNIITGEEHVATIVGIYRERDTGHSDSIFEGISTGKIVLQAEEVSSIKGKRMAVSYTDIDGDSQVAYRIPYELEYIDDDLEAGAYYYRIVAVREGVIGEEEKPADETIEKKSVLSSHPSKPISVKVFDSSPPEPPEWGRVEWVKLDDEGHEHAWEEEVENYKPAAVLEWHVRQPGIKCILQRRVEDREIWTSVSQWLSSEEDNEADERWSWVFFDKTVREDSNYFYRLKLVNNSGKTTLSEEIAPENRRR